MEQLLVLGQIPGTEIEITFSIWLNCLAMLVLSIFLVIFVWSSIRRSKRLGNMQPRSPLYASRLHL